MEPSALRLQKAARAMFALAAQSRSSPYKSPPRRANQSEHDVAASLKMPRSPPMQFQPVSRSTHAVCTSGTLHIVPLLLTAHNLLIKIPVLALPLSHDSDPLPAQTQVLGMEASQPYLSITCTPQQGAEKSKTCANDFFVYCYRMCFVPCCVQMYAACFFSD